MSITGRIRIADSALFPAPVQHFLPLPLADERHALVDAAAADRRRRERLLAQLVLGNEPELLWVGGEDRRLAGFIGGIDVVVDQHQRRAERPADALLPLLFP